MDVYASPSGVVRGVPGGPDVYLGINRKVDVCARIDVGLESSKMLKFPG